MFILQPRVFITLAVSAVLAHADQIVLKNGDRVTGSVIKKDAKNLTIKTEAFGVITAPWDQVSSVTTDKPVNVELSNGDKVAGTLSTSAGRVIVKTEAAPLEVPLADVAVVRNADEQKLYENLLAPPWTRLWAGAANFGIAGTQGNAETLTVTAGINAARVTRTDKASVYFNAIKASALVNGVNATTAKAVRGGIGYSHNLGSRLFINGFNDYEYDRFQNLDLRFVLGGGFGWIVFKQERTRFDILGGGAFNRESFAATLLQSGFTRKSGEAYFGDDFTLKVNSTTSLYQNLRFFPNLSNTGEYRINFDLGANTKLTKWLIWNTSISDRYLSNPVVGRKKNDFLYSTGIGVTFSR